MTKVQPRSTVIRRLRPSWLSPCEGLKVVNIQVLLSQGYGKTNVITMELVHQKCPG